MKVFLHEIKEVEKEYEFSEKDPWVAQTLQRADEKPSPPRPAQLHFELHRLEDVYMVQGDVQTKVHLLCSRCAAPFAFPIDTRFTLLFSKDPTVTGADDHSKGHARSTPSSAEGWETEIDVSHLKEDFIDLSEVFAEQIQLVIPFQPLCKDDCKGMCANCGADLNKGRCACGKIATASPFSALKELKLKPGRK